MAGLQNNSGIDLERELMCSICTDVLYQPLTLLDCLHTFCGSCLKEWFSFQARSGGSSSLTCPSCRARVRGTKPNATVTTLLDMFLAANPGRDRSEEEKDEISKRYRPGDDVLPKAESRRRRAVSDAAEEEDRRILEEVRQISLQEVGVSSGRSTERSRERRRRERSRDNRDEARRSRTADGRAPGGTTHHHRTDPRRDHSRDERVAQETRRVEHQSSLRSLLSASDLDNQELQEEIMRQIMEEGLLDGIDWDNLDAAQEEEVTERIAQAYQRRQRQREGTRSERSTRSNPPSPQIGAVEEPQRRRAHASSESSSRPPVSRPRFLEAATERDRHQRGSSAGSSHRSPRPANLELSDSASRQAARSATDLSDRPVVQENEERRIRMAHTDRRATDPERRTTTLAHNNRSGSNNNSNPSSPRAATFGAVASSNRGADSGSTSNSRSARATVRHDSMSSTVARAERPSNNSNPTLVATSTNLEPPNHQNNRSSSASAASHTNRAVLFPEPSITCNRCGAQHIEYTLHYNCHKCNEGKYNICLRCYRIGEGCLHWFGFGHGSERRYEAKAPPGGYAAGTDHPHVLTGHRYTKPRIEPTPANTPGGSQRLTDDDPSRRLEIGVFCSHCSDFANACYWRCDICNDGEWGFCNACVNKGKHCTHALLPLKQTSKRLQHPEETGTHQLLTSSPPPEALPQSASILHGPIEYVALANTLFHPLTFSTRCDICRYPIPPSNTRFHCGTCNKGDYDICNNCYTSLVASGRITEENGHNGWRRCLRGHRMCIVGFEDRGDGRMRVVVRDIVGGQQQDDQTSKPRTSSPDTSTNSNASPSWGWREDDGTWRSAIENRATNPTMPNTNLGRFPPDGGAGMRVSAMYGYWPDVGIRDELGFPKGAEIREVMDINGDWYFGVYCGVKGLFQANYTRLIR